MKEKGLNHGLPEIGYFVDWDGNVRRVEAPGGGFSCKVVRHAYYLGVDVMDSEGFVIFDAVYYSSMAELRELGVTASLHEEAVG